MQFSIEGIQWVESKKRSSRSIPLTLRDQYPIRIKINKSGRTPEGIQKVANLITIDEKVMIDARFKIGDKVKIGVTEKDGDKYVVFIVSDQGVKIHEAKSTNGTKNGYIKLATDINVSDLAFSKQYHINYKEITVSPGMIYGKLEVIE